MTLTGPSGELRHGYFVAARLGRWTWKGGRLTAALLSSAPFYLSRRPLDVVVQLGSKSYRWSGVDPQIAGGRVVVAATGSPEAVHGS